MNGSQIPVLLEEYTFEEAHRQSERLIPELIAVLERHHVPLEAVSRLITTRGPGSFTGMRIAYSTIKAFVHRYPMQVEVVEGSEALALHWLSENPFSGDLKVVTRIATEKYFVCEFRWQENRLERSRESITEKVPTEGTVLVNAQNQYPLKSRFLVETLNQNVSRQAFSAWDEIKALEPLYLGDTRFQ